MSDLKTTPNEADVLEFLLSVEDPQRRKDALKLHDLMKRWLGMEPKMWGKTIVGYGSYHYRYASGREGDWMKVGFSPRKQNLTLYIMAGFDEYAKAANYDPRPLLEKLGPHSTGKSCLYIKNLDEVNLDALKQLVINSADKIEEINSQ